jgi:hypothetical protein
MARGFLGVADAAERAQASPLIAVKLARYLGSDPYDALKAFGHQELVDLLTKKGGHR